MGKYATGLILPPRQQRKCSGSASSCKTSKGIEDGESEKRCVPSIYPRILYGCSADAFKMCCGNKTGEDAIMALSSDAERSLRSKANSEVSKNLTGLDRSKLVAAFTGGDVLRRLSLEEHAALAVLVRTVFDVSLPFLLPRLFNLPVLTASRREFRYKAKSIRSMRTESGTSRLSDPSSTQILRTFPS